VKMTLLALHGSEVVLLPLRLSGASRGFTGVMQSAPVEFPPCQTFTRRLHDTT
jgi:hypothetical protein